MLQQVEGTAVDGLGGHNVLSRLGQRLNGVGDCRGAGGYRQGSAAAFQGRDALFKHALGGIGQPAVDVAGVPQAETVCRMLGVMENIGSGGVNRNRAGIGGGISLLLADVQLFGFKGPVGRILDIRHCSYLLTYHDY